MPYLSITETKLKDLFRLQPKIFNDNRGWYSPTLEISEFEAATGIKFNLTQVATSFNAHKGVFRGLHYQKPETQGKLVMATVGSILDIVLDIRQNSPTFGQHLTELLSAEQQNQLWIPPGFAHGYLALEDNSRFTYFVTDGIYSPASEKGVNVFDPQLAIDLPMTKEAIIIKDKDLNFPYLADIKSEDLL